MIRLGARLVQNARAKPIRTLAAIAFLTLLLVAAAVNIWAWRHLREANRLAEQQRFAKAHSHYDRCLQIWRWSASIHLLAGRAARRGGLFDEAERHLTAVAELQGASAVDSFPLALERLLLRAQSGDLSDVEQILWSYVKKDKPETNLILEAMARGYLRMLRTGTAIGCLQMLLEREPDNIEGLLARGWILEGGGDTEAAQKDYRRALELDPERDDARLGLARVLLLSNPQEARSQFEIVTAHQPDNSDAQIGLAEAYLDLGEPEKARPLFDALLQKDPENSRALAGLGVLVLTPANMAEGEALLRRAIFADPGNVKAHYHLYVCLAQQPGREAEAEAQLATHKRVKADFERLAQLASKELTLAPNDPNLHYEMGTIYLRYGKPAIGVRWLYSALKLDETHQPSHQALYDYYKESGQLEMAELHRKKIGPSPGKPASP